MAAPDTFAGFANEKQQFKAQFYNAGRSFSMRRGNLICIILKCNFDIILFLVIFFRGL